jgi:uncharacterized protein (DUF58 family)
VSARALRMRRRVARRSGAPRAPHARAPPPCRPPMTLAIRRRSVRSARRAAHPRLVNSTFAGEYRSIFKGQGMEFAEVREYQPGDEVRSIDWNVTARMRRPFVKRYIEERELTLMLAVDISGSERYGTVRRFKSEIATELARC